ncbi:MAG: S8 family peptidase, partial [Candidatus Thorarchaeota archaeon]
MTAIGRYVPIILIVIICGTLIQNPIIACENNDVLTDIEDLILDREQVIPVLDESMNKTLLQLSPDDTTRVLIELREQISANILIQIKQSTKNKVLDLFEEQVSEKDFASVANFETSHMRKDIHEVFVSSYESMHSEMYDQIQELNGTVIHSIYFANVISAYLSPDAIIRLAENPEVRRITEIGFQELCLDTSTPTINASAWTLEGYNGTMVEVAVLDTGIDDTHPALIGQVIDSKSFIGSPSTDDPHGHGTRIAGIIASTDTTYKGVASGAKLINAQVATSLGAYWDDVMAGAEWAVSEATGSADIISASIGCDGDVGNIIDAFVSDYNVVWVGPAGNSGPDSGTVDESGYNMITVGSMNDKNTQTRTDDEISSFSSRGPTDSGAIKPDVVAPGSGIVSTSNIWETDDNFESASGTSYAVPHISGAVALLYDYRFTDTEYYKALLIQTAEDYGNIGPDGDYGWGYIDLGAAYQQKDRVIIEEISSYETIHYGVNMTEGQSFKSSLVFERNGWYSNYIYNDVENLRDIDLHLYSPDGTLLDSSTSYIDNVEQVSLQSAPESGMYLLEVDKYYSGSTIHTYALATNLNVTRLYAPEITSVFLNDVELTDYETISDQRPKEYEITISAIATATERSELNVSLLTDNPYESRTESYLEYNNITDSWITYFDLSWNASAGEWIIDIEVFNSHPYVVSWFTFYLNCENENPIIYETTKNCSSLQRDCETLLVTANVSDYHDHFNLDVYLYVNKSDSSDELYVMNFDSGIFKLELILQATAPLGIWSLEIHVLDQEDGFSSTPIGTLEVFNTQYYVTVISDYGSTSGSGWYDGGAFVSVGVNINSHLINEGNRTIFLSWSHNLGDSHSCSEQIAVYSDLIIIAEWGIEYYLTIQSEYAEPKGEGWWTANRNTSTRLQTEIYELSIRERVLFVEWIGDANGTNYRASNKILMDRPKTVRIMWQKQFHLRIEIDPDFLERVNELLTYEGWYNESEMVYI